MRKEYFLIVLLAILILGVDGCPQVGLGGTGAPGTGAAKYGIDFSPVAGIGYISSGKTVSLGDALFVKAHLENYDTQAHSGKICIRDDIADAYGGIQGEQCKSFSIKSAETITTAGKEQLQSAKTDVLFSESGEYSYHDIPISQAVKLFVDLEYAQSSKITGALNTPEPETEKLTLEQNPAPVTVNIEKTVRKRTEGYQIELGITLQKIMTDAKIYTPDFKTENALIMAIGNLLSFECTPSLSNSGLIEFENTKFIRCSALTNEETQISYPLVISLDYGVKINRIYNFNIKI